MSTSSRFFLSFFYYFAVENIFLISKLKPWQCDVGSGTSAVKYKDNMHVTVTLVEEKWFILALTFEELFGKNFRAT